MKGVLICGGIGSRLRPLTDATNKSLLPVYDKPLILYPLQVLLDAGIRDVIIITGKEHIDQMTNFLHTTHFEHCALQYKVQEKPGGIAQALGLAEEFAKGESICTILGDNIFFDDLSKTIRSFKNGGHLFLKNVPDPERFGVVEVEETDTGALRVTGIEEKPKEPKTDLIATGCYLYDHRCFDIIRSLTPSARGELEITDVSAAYINDGTMRGTILKKEWIDAGTFESLYRAATLVRKLRMKKPTAPGTIVMEKAGKL
jgi:glucose-1-phosphate thymidylyltransferase